MRTLHSGYGPVDRQSTGLWDLLADGKSRHILFDEFRLRKTLSSRRLLVNVVLAMRRRNESGFELRGRQIDAALQHEVEELRRSARCRSAWPIPNRSPGRGVKKNVNIDPTRFTVTPGGVHAVNCARARFEHVVDLGMRHQIPQHRESRRHRQRIAGQRSGLINRPERRDLSS